MEILKDHVVNGEKVTIKRSSDKPMTVADRLKAGPKKTRIIMKNHDTGEVLGEFENKVVISGAQLNACAMFGLSPSVLFPTYNQEMGLDNSDDPSQSPMNNPLVCLFGVSDAGCGATKKDVYITSFTDRIKPPPADPTSTDERSISARKHSIILERLDITSRDLIQIPSCILDMQMVLRLQKRCITLNQIRVLNVM